MKLVDVDKAIQICGNNNHYQRILFMITVLTWFSVDYISITFPLLEKQPKYQCKNPMTGIYFECKEEVACTDDYRDTRIETIIYNNIFSHFDLSCQTLLVMLIGITYIIGVFLGAIIFSKFADTFGRKPVLLINNFLFAVSCISLTIAPSIYIIFGILFFTGMTCAGGTMISFLMINESIAAHKRSLYGTLVNSSFSLAGIVYFLSFQYVNNWKVIAYISAAANIVSIVLIMFYIIESPRYLYSRQKYLKFFMGLHKLARINGKSKDYLRYLKSDAIYITNEKQDSSTSDSNLNNDLKNTLSDITDDGDKTESDNRINNNSLLKATKRSNSETLLPNDSNDNLPDKPSKNEINHQIHEIIARYNKINVEKLNPTEDAPLSRANVSSVTQSNSNSTNISSSNTSLTTNASINLKEKEYGYLSLLRYRSLRSKFLILNLIWFYCCFVYTT